ncbi:CdaR family protein [Peribacillus glennii]|uniref:YbbR-like domain-containing protein n=1 Tax=Peribacillus glennii TaxID=2303991 RepID=A0A372L755_9BACI|nr:CdaR family protein [Peribacillus glennii]RFU61024.1 YbbR-like domain-containing protein [Peribacillus glennii]
MDKFMNSPWFVRIVSLALAALLFTSINLQPESSKGQLGFNTPGKTYTATIQNVPVEIDYDQENLVVTGAPRTVDVTLKGAKPLVVSAKNRGDLRVYIDLSDPDLSLGQKNVRLKVRDMNEKLTAKINPEIATVTIQERVTQEFSVDPEFNRSLLEDGYVADQPRVNPKTVKITGAKDVIERISYVKAIVELNRGITDTVQQKAKVQALDRDLNKLDVLIDPEAVTVSVQVSIPAKKVPIVAVQTGTPADGLKIKEISVEPKEVTLYGKESVLQKISEVRLPVSVGNIEGDAEFELPLNLPDNVHKMSRDTATIKVRTEKESPKDNDMDEQENQEDQENQKDQEVVAQTKTFHDLTIQTVGNADDTAVTFISPPSGRTSITLTGDPENLKKITGSDIQLSVNVNRFEEGKHDATIQVKAPSNVKWELPLEQATVSITKKNSEHRGSIDNI